MQSIRQWMRELSIFDNWVSDNWSTRVEHRFNPALTIPLFESVDVCVIILSSTSKSELSNFPSDINLSSLSRYYFLVLGLVSEILA